MKLPSAPISNVGAPGLPVSSGPFPAHPGPTSAGFVFKPGTFLPASTQQNQTQQDLSKVPLLSGRTVPTRQSFSTEQTQLPSLTPPSASVSGMGSPLKVTTTDATMPTLPFTTSLPLSGGFQFSMKSSVSPSLGKHDEESDTEPTTLVQPSSLITALTGSGGGLAVSTSSVPFTTSVVVTQSQSSLSTTTVPPLSALASGEHEETDADRDTSYDACPNFEPIVSLPEVGDISTGEENENTLFSHRAKLYRFDSNAGAWKDRGIGDIKILQHKNSGKARIVMRREQVLKLCCNHYITAEMSLTPLPGNNQLAWYTLCDFADGVAKAEKLAVRFKQADVAGEFQKVFEACASKASRSVKDSTDGHPSPSSASVSLKDKFSAPVGSWECDTCLVQNQSPAVKCVACGSSKPGSENTGSHHTPPTTGSVTVKSTLPVTETGGSAGMFQDSGTASIGERGGLNLGMSSLGTLPVFSSASAVTTGGFKMGGLTLGTLPKFTAEPGKAVGGTSEGENLETSSHVPVSGILGTGGGFKIDSGIIKWGGSTLPSTSSDEGTKATGLSFPSLTKTFPPTIGASASSTVPSAGESKQEPFSFSLAPEKHSIFSTSAPEGGGMKPFVIGASNNAPPEGGGGKPFVFGVSNNAPPEGGGVKPFVFGASNDAPTSPAVDEQNVSHDSSVHEPDIHFDPIVTLPEAVDIHSGEENEDALFTERAKLYRFDSSLKQWKERGIGEMKILVNRDAGKARVLMRRELVLKICCNHFITSVMSLAPMAGTKKAWTWFTPCDFADETGRPEKLAARFKSPGIADTFKKAFEEAMDFVAAPASAGINDGNEEVLQDGEEEEKECGYAGEEEATARSSGKLFDFTAKFGPPAGSWECNSCYVTNQRDKEVCCACGEPRPKESSPQQHTVSSASTPFAFLPTPSPQLQQQIKFGARLNITPRHTVAKEYSPEREVERESSSSRSPSPTLPTAQQSALRFEEDGDSDDVIFVGVDLPSEDKIKEAEKYLLPPSFYNYELQPPCPGCRGCVDLLEGPYEPETKSGPQSGSDRKGEPGKVEGGDTAKKEARQVQLKSFGTSHFGVSFSTLAASTNDGSMRNEGGFWGQPSSGFPGFKGAGSQLFSAKPTGVEEEGHIPEAEVDINFKPIVTLDEVEVKTGEEDDECLFSHRAKLYRFDADLRQWKERGLGDMKILKNTATGKSRVVMRREQILKLCCNHLITSDMTLQENTSNPKSWTWQTLSDFTDQTAREETFTVRFKHMEVAQQFGEIFRLCQTDCPDEQQQEVTPEGEPTQLPADTQSAETEDTSSSSSCVALKETLELTETGMVM